MDNELKLGFKRGERLNYSIKLTTKNRIEFSKINNISINTLRAWIKPKHVSNMINEKKVQKIINLLFKNNIIVSKEWLLNGNGIEAVRKIDSNYISNLNQPDKEIKNYTFKLLRNDDLYPIFNKYTYVAGQKIRFSTKSILPYINTGQLCYFFLLDNHEIAGTISKVQDYFLIKNMQKQINTIDIIYFFKIKFTREI